MKQLSIIKVGGQILENSKTRSRFVSTFATIRGYKLLVHGGGRLADLYLEKLGITPRMMRGRRLTDAATLDVVTMVYGGLINKQVVAALQSRGVNAIGLSGADGNVVSARKRPPGEYDYGFAGDITGVDSEALSSLLTAGYTPVLCPLTHDNHGQILNANADTIAMEVAQAMSRSYAVSLRYCIDHPGVLLDVQRVESVVPELNYADYSRYCDEQIIVDGMIPKLDNAFAARRAGISEVVIAGLDTISDPDKATRIVL